MASLKDYPVIMNGTEVPFFPEIDNDPKKLLNENESEGGRRIIQLIRQERLDSSIRMELADYQWVQFFAQLNQLDSFIFKQYSPLTNGYVEKNVFLNNFKYKAKKHSEDLSAVTGVWEVSFTLEEF